MPEIISNTDPAFVPMFVTLCQTSVEYICDEGYVIDQNDYIIVVPEEIAKSEKTDIKAYCEHILREAAKATMLGTSCEKILYGIHWYKWSDAIMYSKHEELASLGIYDILGYNGDITKDMLINRITVNVYTYENLLPESIQGTFLVQRSNSSKYICIPDCRVNLYKGRVYVSIDEIALIGAKSLAIDFGNGIKHPVAYGKRNRKYKENIFFYVKEGKRRFI